MLHVDAQNPEQVDYCPECGELAELDGFALYVDDLHPIAQRHIKWGLSCAPLRRVCDSCDTIEAGQA